MTERKRLWTAPLAKSINQILKRPTLDLDDLRWLAGSIEVDGESYVDLRSFPLKVRLQAKNFALIDFSYSKWPLTAGFAVCGAEKCRFCSIRFGGIISGTFRDCSFDECSISGPYGTDASTFENCTFAGAVLRGGTFYASTFLNCSFRGCKMRTTEFLECRFNRCDFSGVLFDEGSLGHSIISQPLQNFRYVNPNDMTPLEFVADPSFETVDIGETSTVGTRFEKL